MKKIAAIGLLVGQMCNAGVAFALDFGDVDLGDKNYVAIKFLTEEGVLRGYEDGSFEPGKSVNRAEALKIIFEGLKAEVGTFEGEDTGFTDVAGDEWYADYVYYGKREGIVGGDPDGSFAPGRTVVRSEFLKMLLMTVGFAAEEWKGEREFADVEEGEWYAVYMNYAGEVGLLTADAENQLRPGDELSRGEVAEIMYLLIVILRGKDTQLLISQSEEQMAQIEKNIESRDFAGAKRAAELAVEMTQQAYLNRPTDNVVLGAAKIARAYEFLVNAYVALLEDDLEGADEWVERTIDKATEAWEANNATQRIAAHVKGRAREVRVQIESRE